MNRSPCPDFDSLTISEIAVLQNFVRQPEATSTAEDLSEHVRHVAECEKCQKLLREVGGLDRYLQQCNQQIPVNNQWLEALQQHIPEPTVVEADLKNEPPRPAGHDPRWWMALATAAMLILTIQLIWPDPPELNNPTSPKIQEARKQEAPRVPPTRLRSNAHLVANAVSTDEEIDIFVILPISGRTPTSTTTITQ